MSEDSIATIFHLGCMDATDHDWEAYLAEKLGISETRIEVYDVQRDSVDFGIGRDEQWTTTVYAKLSNVR